MRWKRNRKRKKNKNIRKQYIIKLWQISETKKKQIKKGKIKNEVTKRIQKATKYDNKTIYIITVSQISENKKEIEKKLPSSPSPEVKKKKKN